MPETWWCDGIRNAIADPLLGFVYRPHQRIYAIWSFHENGLLESQSVKFEHRPDGMMLFQIRHCPWCGSELPYHLQYRWCDLLEELGTTLFEDTPIPEELTTDAWWKNAATPFPSPDEDDSFEDMTGKCFDLDGEFGVAAFCNYMVQVLGSGRPAFTYQAKWREYGIRRFQADKPVWSQQLDYVRIDYSPWCGRRFPHSLKDYWTSMMKRVELDPVKDTLPDGYVTDLWWRKTSGPFPR